MRPTGNLHLGTYEGALKNWIRLQDSGKYECFYFIADLHALTSDYADTSAIKQNTIDMVSDWVAAGLDPKHFPPIPTAAGFLGVLLPLLFFEVRLIR